MSVTPKVRINQIPTQRVATITPPTLPACIIGPMAQIFAWDSDKIKSLIGTYGKGANVSISEKYGWITSSSVSPCFTGNFAGVDNDAVPDFDNSQIIINNPKVLVGIDNAASGTIAVSGGTVTITVSNSKLAGQVAVGDYVYVALSGSGSPEELVVVGVNAGAGNTVLTLNKAPAGGAGSYYWSIERKVSTTEFDKNFIWPSSTDINEFSIYQGAKINNLNIIYGELHNTLVAPKVGTYGIESISSVNDVQTKVGSVSEYNPLAMALAAALSYASTTVYYIPVPAQYTYDEIKKTWEFDYVPGFAYAKELLSGNRIVYRVVPLSLDPVVLGFFKTEAEDASLPDKSIFRKVYGSVDIPTTKSVVDSVNPSDISSIDVTNDTRYNVFSGDSDADPFFSSTSLTSLPMGGWERMYMGLGYICDEMEIIDAEDISSNKVNSIIGRKYKIDKVNVINDGGTYKIKEIKVTTPVQTTSAINLSSLTVKFYDKYNNVVLGTEIITNGTGTLQIRNSTSGWGRLRNKINFTSFNPLNSGVEVGDYLKILVPLPGLEPYGASLWQNAKKPTVEVVKFKVTSVGVNNVTIDTTNYDLWDSSILTLSVNNPYRMGFIRELDTTGVVEEADAISQSINSSRVVLFTPGYVKTTLFGGSTTVPVYIYAAATAAIRSILPVHKSMTRYSIPGFYMADAYKAIPSNIFENISNKGFYVLAQDTESAGLYCFHQLTSTRSGLYFDEELSCSENLDEISKSTKAIIDVYIGKYNITDMVMGIITASIKSMLVEKKSSYHREAGSQITGFSDPIVMRGLGTSDGQMTAKPGYVTVYFTVNLPEVLNNAEVFIYY